MKLTPLNVILILIASITTVISVVLYFNVISIKKDLNSYEDIKKLNKDSEQFINDFVQGNYGGYLTGKELEKHSQAKDDVSGNNDTTLLSKDVDIQQLFTKEDGKNKAKSYATIQVRYESNESETYADDYFQTLSLKTDWIKEGKKWKVNNLDVSILGDSEEEKLIEQSKKIREEASEKEEGNSNE